MGDVTDLTKRVESLRKRDVVRREEEAARNRRDFPELMAVLEEFRSVFGPETRVIWATNGVREVGRRVAFHDRPPTKDGS
jgi:hypothetical protein